MYYSSETLEKLISEFTKMPGIGRKTAQRLALYLLKIPKEDAFSLADTITQLRNKVSSCAICYNITETEPCNICADKSRDHRVICVVETPSDVIAIEKTQQYKGLYHVLGGAISPLENIPPEALKINELLSRLQQQKVNEVIIATNPNVDGEATAMYLAKLIKPMGIKLTRIARGLPVGAHLEHADEVTLIRAMEGRKEFT